MPRMISSLTWDILIRVRARLFRGKAILRADFFNFLNRNVFNVNMSIGNANFGRATSSNLQPRFVTMGMRLEF